jgi:hypothetical protein
MSLTDSDNQLRAAKYYQSMNGQVIIEEHPMPPDLGRLFEQARPRRSAGKALLLSRRGAVPFVKINAIFKARLQL